MQWCKCIKVTSITTILLISWLLCRPSLQLCHDCAAGCDSCSQQKLATCHVENCGHKQMQQQCQAYAKPKTKQLTASRPCQIIDSSDATGHKTTSDSLHVPGALRQGSSYVPCYSYVSSRQQCVFLTTLSTNQSGVSSACTGIMYQCTSWAQSNISETALSKFAYEGC